MALELSSLRSAIKTLEDSVNAAKKIEAMEGMDDIVKKPFTLELYRTSRSATSFAGSS